MLHDVLLNILYQFQQENNRLMYFSTRFRTCASSPRVKPKQTCLFRSLLFSVYIRSLHRTQVLSEVCYYSCFGECYSLWHESFTIFSFCPWLFSSLQSRCRRGTFTLVRNHLCTKKSGVKCQINKDPILSARTSQGGLLTLTVLNLINRFDKPV